MARLPSATAATEPPRLLTTDDRERMLLAPFAMFSRASAGRRYAEPTHPYRGPYQRDRDRILHSSAYRRLSGKMQVFTKDRGDYHRTRLTHTQEVASIARTMGRALRLNEDLIEALALFHDIGHPPFGHAGEDALANCLAEQGGFSHNRFALTVAEELENPYPEFPGLNLTWELLEGQVHRIDKRGLDPQGRSPLLEVQVVDAADSITYDAHDTDDAVKLELVSLDELAELPIIRQLLQQVHRRYSDLSQRLVRRTLVHDLIDWQVSDLFDQAEVHLSEAEFRSADEARRSGWRLAFSAEVEQQKRELESFLYDRVYRHPTIIEVRQAAQSRLGQMFRALCRDPQYLPGRFRARIEQVGLQRAVGDYLAAMTDRYCDQQFQVLCALPHAPPPPEEL